MHDKNLLTAAEALIASNLVDDGDTVLVGEREFEALAEAVRAARESESEENIRTV